SWLPPGLPAPSEQGPALCPGEYLTPEQGQALLQATLDEFPNTAAWGQYASLVRQRIQQGAGLAPWPRRTPLNPIIGPARTHDGYTVSNVALETAPGLWVSGNLFQPSGR